MTPRHVFEEMTLEEVQECVAHVMSWELHPQSKEQYKALTDGLERWLCSPAVQGQDLGWLKPLGKVIRRG